MAIAKGAILQHLMLFKEGIDLRRHFSTRGAGLQKAHAQLVSGDVDLPDPAAGGVNLAHEHRAFQGGVIARDHREGVQAQDIPALQDTAGYWVMRTIGVDARLEPHPSVAVFGIWKALGDFQLHRVAPGHGDVQLARAFAHRFANGKAANIGHARAMANDVQFGLRFRHPLPHGAR